MQKELEQMEEFEDAVRPLVEYMKKRRSIAANCCDGAIVIATYERVTLYTNKMGIPYVALSRECNRDQHGDRSV